jgi:hypothetical protein
MLNLERRIFVPGASQPYIFEAGAVNTDADVLRVLHQLDPSIPTTATLAWEEVEDATGHYYKTTVVPPAQTKG